MNNQEETWNRFWEDQNGRDLEWSRTQVLASENLRLFYEDIKDKKTTLELGAGMGLFSFYLANQGMKTTLLDNSFSAYTGACNFWKKYDMENYIVEDLFKYKPEEKYDVVFSCGLCEHFVGRRRARILKKHLEFVKDDGIVIISVPYKYGIFYRIGKFVADLIGYWNFGLEVPFSKKELRDFAEKNELDYNIMVGGFNASMYDLAIRKPLKYFGIHIKRRFDNTPSLWDSWLGSGLSIVMWRGKND
jgi:2-polyprenyl-3-methyl-5-hydroxy-6-metoxy-1,4-benzoquinol methylase